MTIAQQKKMYFGGLIILCLAVWVNLQASPCNRNTEFICCKDGVGCVCCASSLEQCDTTGFVPFCKIKECGNFLLPCCRNGKCTCCSFDVFCKIGDNGTSCSVEPKCGINENACRIVLAYECCDEDEVCKNDINEPRCECETDKTRCCNADGGNCICCKSDEICITDGTVTKCQPCQDGEKKCCGSLMNNCECCPQGYNICDSDLLCKNEHGCRPDENDCCSILEIFGCSCCKSGEVCKGSLLKACI